MQGFGCVCVLLCLWLGLAVGQIDANVTTTRPTEATLAPEQTTPPPNKTTKATLAPESHPTEESPATLAPEHPTLSPTICNKPGYDLGPLARAPFWRITVQDKGQCLQPHDTSVQSCTIYLAICHPILSSTLCPGQNSSICQEVTLTNGSKVYYNMGTYDSNHTYATLDTGTGFYAERHGMIVDTTRCTGVIISIISFYCDSSASWDASHTNVTNDLVSPSLRDPAQGCLYDSMQFNYNGACGPVSPVGWIFIGIFLGLVLIYLVIGSAYQYFGKHERGIRILPNYDFWKAFAGYVRDGVLLCLNAITCFQFRGKFKKVDYDKL